MYIMENSMLPCVCPVIDHRWCQNVVKTMKWYTSRRRVCYWCFYQILTSSVIYYWTDPRQHGIYLFYTMIRKENRPIHIPASYRMTDCSRIWASLGIFYVPSATFRLCFFSFLLTWLYTVSSKSFSTSFIAQSRIRAKKICITASLT